MLVRVGLPGSRQDRDVIPKMMQLVASRIGATFNKLRGLKGAFWEKRYHANGVETKTI